MVNTTIKIKADQEKFKKMIRDVQKYCNLIEHLSVLEQADKEEILGYNMVDKDAIKDLIDEANKIIIEYVTSCE